MGFITKNRYYFYIISITITFSLIFFVKCIGSTLVNICISLLASLIVAFSVDMINSRIQKENNKTRRLFILFKLRNILIKNIEYSLKRLTKCYELIEESFADCKSIPDIKKLKKIKKGKEIAELYRIIAKNDKYILEYVSKLYLMVDYEKDNSKRNDNQKQKQKEKEKYGNRITDIYLSEYYGIKYIKKISIEIENISKFKELLIINEIFSNDEICKLVDFKFLIDELYNKDARIINSASNLLIDFYENIPDIIEILYK